MLSLMNAPVTAQLRRKAALFAAVLLGVTLIVLPFAREAGPEIAPFMPAFGASVILFDLITAYLLRGQLRQSREPATIFLYAAYLYSGLIVIPHILTFPDVFSRTGLLGAGAQTGIWLWVSWHGGFPALVLLHATAQRAFQGRVLDEKQVRSYLRYAALSVASGIAVLTLLVTRFQDRLPVLVNHGNYLLLVTSGIGPVVWLLNALALSSVWQVFRGRTVTHLWLLVVLFASLLDVTITLFAGSRYSLGWYVARFNSLTASMVVLASLLNEITKLYAEVARANRELQKIAMIDSLTGLGNRRLFNERIDLEWRRAQREQHPLSLVMLDIDHFKALNDTHGHQVGDQCLRVIGEAIRDCAGRPGDLVARYGGEEFCVVLPATPVDSARHVAEKLRRKIETLRIPPPDGTETLSVTVSIGIKTLTPGQGDNMMRFISEADAALYAAKHAGRNRVHIAEDAPDGATFAPDYG